MLCAFQKFHNNISMMIKKLIVYIIDLCGHWNGKIRKTTSSHCHILKLRPMDNSFSLLFFNLGLCDSWKMQQFIMRHRKQVLHFSLKNIFSVWYSIKYLLSEQNRHRCNMKWKAWIFYTENVLGGLLFMIGWCGKWSKIALFYDIQIPQWKI